MTLRLHGANSPPVADAGGGRTVELGSSVTLDGSGSTDPDGDALAYTWTGDFAGGTATGVSPTVTFASVGAHTVTLSVDDGHGHTSTATTVVRVAYGFTWLTSGPLTAKAGSAVPLKWAVTGAPSAAPVVTVTDLGCALGSTPSLAHESGNATGSPHDSHVVWVWKTPKTYAGSCKQVSVDVGDGVQHTLDVTFR
jgi:PKD repeat protein